jgi:hypothetical protein
MGKPVVEMQKLGVQTRWPPEECASPLAHFTLSKTTREEMEFSPVLMVPSVVQVLPSALIVSVNFDSVAPLELPESYRVELTFFTQTFMISCPWLTAGTGTPSILDKLVLEMLVVAQFDVVTEFGALTGIFDGHNLAHDTLAAVIVTHPPDAINGIRGQRLAARSRSLHNLLFIRLASATSLNATWENSSQPFKDNASE